MLSHPYIDGHHQYTGYSYPEKLTASCISARDVYRLMEGAVWNKEQYHRRCHALK